MHEYVLIQDKQGNLCQECIIITGAGRKKLVKFVKVTGSGASTFGVRAWGDVQNPRKVHLGFQVQSSHEGFHFHDWSAHLVVTIIKIMMYWVYFGVPSFMETAIQHSPSKVNTALLSEIEKKKGFRFRVQGLGFKKRSRSVLFGAMIQFVLWASNRKQYHARTGGLAASNPATCRMSCQQRRVLI